MKRITKKETEILLRVFKDFSTDYNANSLSKQLDITPRGALKILKSLKAQNLLVSKQMGKAVFYKINTHDEYALKLVSLLLMKEAQEKAARWMAEFRDLAKITEISIFFGSAVRNPAAAMDIDILLVFRKERLKQVREFIDEKNKILLKPIHPLIQTLADLKRNLKKKDPVIINAVRHGFVLYGHDSLIKEVKNVTSL